MVKFRWQRIIFVQRSYLFSQLLKQLVKIWNSKLVKISLTNIWISNSLDIRTVFCELHMFLDKFLLWQIAEAIIWQIASSPPPISYHFQSARGGHWERRGKPNAHFHVLVTTWILYYLILISSWHLVRAS